MKYLVSATETSSIAANSPTYDQIVGALRPRSGTWIGPAPRVTRPSGDYFLTKFAWPIEIGTAAEVEPLRAAIGRALSQIRNSFFSAADWSELRIVPYVESVHGPISSWTSGAASQTLTQNAPVGVVTEDPIKPSTNPNTPITTTGAKPPSPKDTSGSNTALWLGLGAVALVSVAIVASRKPAHRNPIGRRPRKAHDDSWILPVLIMVPFVPPF